MQVYKFSKGGFVIHGIKINKNKYSAWYDQKGELLDCERTVGMINVYSVPDRHTKIRSELNKIGKRYI